MWGRKISVKIINFCALIVSDFTDWDEVAMNSNYTDYHTEKIEKLSLYYPTVVQNPVRSHHRASGE